MSGDADNAHLWADADVWVAFDLDTDAPASIDDDFADTAGWELVGLLDGDAGFVESRDEDVNDRFAWGGLLMRTSRNHFKLTEKFTAYEHNETTRRLRWPGSDAGEIRVPRPENILIAFETLDTETGTLHRVISAHHAQCVIDGDVTSNETDMAALPFLVTIYPDGTGLLFTEQETAEGS